MKGKQTFISFILCLIVLCLYFIVDSYKTMNNDATKVYNVYLNGEILGAIASKDDLYQKIDENQQAIKQKYNVSNVYPPNGLEVIEDYSYNAEISSTEEIYNKISTEEDFTIYGYEIKIGKTESHKAFKIYVLDKQVFTDALKQFILAFISEEDYNNYVNNTQTSIEDVGSRYTSMALGETITIKRSYISSNEKIYEDSKSLVQALLFGFDYKEKNYTIKTGDTIASISEENKLNTQEFLIANPEYSSKDSMLAIGDSVNISLINPVLSFSYQVQAVEEVEYNYQTSVVRDSSRPSDFYEVTTPGVNGLSIVTSHYDVVNGEPMSEVVIDNEDVVKETVDQIITKGVGSNIWGNQSIDDSNLGWAWPTENHYFKVTSEFEYRWGKFHQAIDISGTGFGSNIYSANDGVVEYVVNTCEDQGYYGSSCGSGYGNSVVIRHDNGYYTIYAHLTSNVAVKVGQTVTRKQLIGYMGNSGSSTGTHLHFGVSVGDPNHGGTYFNPRKLY